MSSCIWLMGGLGNQLFQVNFGYWLMHRGERVTFNPLLSKRNVARTLTRFNIHPFVLDKLIPDCVIDSSYSLAPLLAKLEVFNSYSSWCGLDGLADTRARHYFGYFQNKALNTTCWFEDSLVLNDVRVYDVAVHLRFGDSLYAPVKPDGLSDMLSQFHPLADVAVLTDDRSKAKELLLCAGVANVEFPEGDLLDDFATISSASNVICADSTFSWWAAKLNKGAERVFAPKHMIERLGPPGSILKVRGYD